MARALSNDMACDMVSAPRLGVATLTFDGVGDPVIPMVPARCVCMYGPIGMVGLRLACMSHGM